MRAWFINKTVDMSSDTRPLEMADVAIPVPAHREIRLRVRCCGVCHTELDEIEGRTPPPAFPVIPGHQVVGIVDGCGDGANRFRAGDRVGVAWIFSTCGTCEFCTAGLENLCASFVATGRDHHGGYAEFMVVNEEFAFEIPDVFSDAEAAPLLCAGAIGFRSLRLAGISNGQTLALTGFGASGHLVLKMARHLYPDSPVIVFARSPEEQRFAMQLGASWAGSFGSKLSTLAHAIIDTTPVWTPVIESLRHLKPGGRLVINAIRKESSDLHVMQSLRYHDHLWMEKEIKSVANITRADVMDFLALAAEIPVRPETQLYPFESANEALVDLKRKHILGAKVLIVSMS